MSKEVHTVDSNATVTEAAEIMAADERNEGYVIVLEKGTPKGIVTERDIVNKSWLDVSIPLTSSSPASCLLH